LIVLKKKDARNESGHDEKGRSDCCPGKVTSYERWYDLDPIENAFAKLKGHIRKAAAKSFETLETAAASASSRSTQPKVSTS
jgi:hypothetical protein